MQLSDDLSIFVFYLLFCQILVLSEVEPLIEVGGWGENLREQEVK